MASEIEEFEKKYRKEREENIKLLEEIALLKIENSALKLENEKYKDDEFIQNQKYEIQKLNGEIMRMHKELKELQKEKGVHSHNERGAGRKPIISSQTKSDIIKARTDGKTIKQIAEQFNVSVGIVHKLINEQNIY